MSQASLSLEVIKNHFLEKAMIVNEGKPQFGWRLIETPIKSRLYKRGMPSNTTSRKAKEGDGGWRSIYKGVHPSCTDEISCLYSYDENRREKNR